MMWFFGRVCGIEGGGSEVVGAFFYGRMGIYACIYGRIGNLCMYLRYLGPEHQENAYIRYL